MTNAEIIITNTARLIHEGIITEENTINTWLGWKMRGYTVKQGEKHIAEFPIWVKNKQKEQEKAEEDTEENGDPKPQKKRREFVFQTAYWFTDKQVKPTK